MENWMFDSQILPIKIDSNIIITKQSERHDQRQVII